MPFSRKHQPSPTAATSRPAIAGPTTRAPLTIEELSAIALLRSSRPTISTTNDWRAGMSKALTMPRQVARTKTCHTRTWPLRVSTASVSGSNIEIDWVRMRMRRRSARSATMPPMVAKRKTGARVANDVTPSRAAEPVRRKTSQDSATDCIQVPVRETSWPAKNSW